MSSLLVKVASIRNEAEGIASYELVRADGHALPAFDAGAHIDVFLPGLPAKQYSLCSCPGETDRYRIAVLKEPESRGGSRHMHEKLSTGDTLTIGLPKNHFALVPEARRSLLVAGGIGVTPLLAMAETLSAEGADFEMHYCARSRSRLAFAELLSEQRFQGRVHLHLDDGPEDQKLALPALLAARDAGDHLYICGPTGFLNWVRDTARQAGWPDEAVHTEYFSGTVEQMDTDTGFEIEIQETGQVICVEKGQTALSALLDAGLDIPNSCTEGVCGMCMTQVAEGTPDHRDQFLTTAERQANDVFMPCCSRAKSNRLVISNDY
ncbi:PDR/VanB family oxidoreductase [Pontivivens nitratireducens]|uniref:PDR/VanB family oxidoreductase n=1 Tax=Pontivivens nitratireducens TaxID=2758038 RepID=UPI00163AE416|nr:PDR/VanB family oxidoreductase [Pontibrevibacter nitratireducens]